jgi:hypothetical protein
VQKEGCAAGETPVIQFVNDWSLQDRDIESPNTNNIDSPTVMLGYLIVDSTFLTRSIMIDHVHASKTKLARDTSLVYIKSGSDFRET